MCQTVVLIWLLTKNGTFVFVMQAYRRSKSNNKKKGVTYLFLQCTHFCEYDSDDDDNNEQ